MRIRSLSCIVLSVVCSNGFGEEQPSISLASHNQRQPLPLSDETQAVERIRKIVLNQGDDARALANLVQLTRELPAPTTSQLYYDLAKEYLQQAKYNQAANLLQQLLNQHADQPIAADALVTLVRLYSSSEVTHTQQASTTSNGGQQGFLQYALYLADHTLLKNPSLANDPAISFQRAVATRLGGNLKAVRGRLSRLKHNPKAAPWHTRALAEPWLQSKREDASPLPTVICRSTEERPHLDGVLDDSLWQAGQPVQFSYDGQFLYLAISTPKATDQNYQADNLPRTHDADLTGHDHLRLRLDHDRDYATCFELAVDHRGQTNDRCWHDTSWNPKWFVAAGGDDSHWTVEAAIPWEELTEVPPQTGEAWAVAWDRILPGEGASATAAGVDFSLLLFK